MSEYVGEPFNPYSLRPHGSRRIVVRTHGGVSFNLDPKYSYIKCIGEGSYGVVISVTNKEDGVKYAIKKIPEVLKDKGNGFRVYREIMIMKHCNHPNVLRLVNVEVDPPRREFTDLYMTMELMETDMSRVIYSKQKLTDDHIQFFTYQILCGLNYLHSANIIHRDLKPSNILLNSDCDLRICDFNLAREDADADGLTEYVQTRWYRAPEVMLASQHYSKAVDMWSVGCILAELLKRDVMFKGTNYLSQLKLYCDILGVPDPKDLSFITNVKGQQYVMGLNSVPRDFKTLFPDANPLCLDLLKKLLQMNPQKRITVEEALEHPYFESIRDPAMEQTCDRLFELDVSDESITREELRDLFIDLSRSQ